jgi:Reverse transcriptase (RNA-dependent DNA polymerase)
VETRKLIAARDVWFVEDQTPGDIAVIDTRGVTPTQTDIEGLVPEDTNQTRNENTPGPELMPNQSELDSPETPADTRKYPPPESDPDPRPPSRPSKWTNLPPQNHPTQSRNPVMQFGTAATEDEIEAVVTTSTGTHHAFIAYTNEPRTYREAMRSPYSKQWEESVTKEYDQLKRTGTFEWVEKVPDGQKAVGSHIVFIIEHNGDGAFLQHKSRIVAKGFSQVPGQDFNDTFASVAKFSTLCTLLSIVAHDDLELNQIDVIGAYLQGDLDEEIYMEVPDGSKRKGRLAGTGN